MDFKFIQDPASKKWVIFAPRRAERPKVDQGIGPICPFCIGREKEENEVYRIGGQIGDSNWQVRVVVNKFPFAQIHEIIIHSPDHHKNFDELPQDQVELILKTYRQRYNIHKKKGQVYIFHNRGEGGGESLPHPHTQLVVIPNNIQVSISPLGQYSKVETIEASNFLISCPNTSQWPDEVWIYPRNKANNFGEISDEEISEFAFLSSRLIQIFDLRHGYEFSFNFYIYPGLPWYLRLIPRAKIPGGFEIGTGIFVNTQDPAKTLAFIKEHLQTPDEEKIKREHQAEYAKKV